MTLILIGLLALIVGGELVVRGASRLAAALRISPLMVGLTVVAFGTSSPELAVSLQSAFSDNSDIALGNVVGSNVFNVLFILGISAMVAPLAVSNQLVRWDVPLMIAASLLVLVLGWDEVIGRADGLLLVSGLVAYVGWCAYQTTRIGDNHQPPQALGNSETPSPRNTMSAMCFQMLLIAAGLVALAVGSNWLITGAVAIATQLGVSQLIIGLTIVAAGTSMPEAVTSIVAAYRGERDIAVGNVVGSNLFNILCVLGLSSAVAPSGIAVSAAAIRFDIPVMIAVAIMCQPVFFTGRVVSRGEGALFLLLYLAYTIYLAL